MYIQFVPSDQVKRIRQQLVRLGGRRIGVDIPVSNGQFGREAGTQIEPSQVGSRQFAGILQVECRIEFIKPLVDTLFAGPLFGGRQRLCRHPYMAVMVHQAGRGFQWIDSVPGKRGLRTAGNRSCKRFNWRMAGAIGS